MTTRYGYVGTDAVKRSLGLADYTSRTSRKVTPLSSSAEKALRQSNEALRSNNEIENIELKDLSGLADGVVRSAQQGETALMTTDDQPDTQAIRKLAGLRKAMTGMRDELVDNLVKLSDVDDRKSEVEKHLAREHKKLTETDDTGIQQEIRDRIRKLEGVVSDLELESQARLEAHSTIREALRFQIKGIHETFRRLLHEDITLAERIRTLFREQEITIVSILTAVGMAFSTLVLALTGGGGSAPAPEPGPEPFDKGSLKDWVEKHLRDLGRVLANLAGKAAAALPWIGGSIVSWLLNTLGKTATWLEENIWAWSLPWGPSFAWMLLTG